MTEDTPSRLEEFGNVAIGPFLLRFCHWLGEEVIAGAFDRVYFLSREGHFLLELFQLAQAERLIEPVSSDCRYLLVSRRALMVAVQKDAVSLEEIARAPYSGLLSDFLKVRVGLQSTAIEKLGIADRPIAIPRDRPEIMDELRSLTPVLEGRQAAELVALRTYLREEQYEAGGNIALVDLGYSGTIQALLGLLTGIPTVGLYGSLSSRGIQRSRPGLETKACFAGDSDSPRRHPIYRCHLLLESVLAAPHGQLLRFELDQDKARAVFDEPGYMQINFDVAETVMKGVRSFFKQAGTLLKAGRFQAELRTIGPAFLEMMKASPRYEVALSRLWVEDRFGGNQELPATLVP